MMLTKKEKGIEGEQHQHKNPNKHHVNHNHNHNQNGNNHHHENHQGDAGNDGANEEQVTPDLNPAEDASTPSSSKSTTDSLKEMKPFFIFSVMTLACILLVCSKSN